MVKTSPSPVKVEITRSLKTDKDAYGMNACISESNMPFARFESMPRYRACPGLLLWCDVLGMRAYKEGMISRL